MASDDAARITRLTIDALAEVVHTPRHVGRLPVGAPVVAHVGDGDVREVISWYVEDGRFVLVTA